METNEILDLISGTANDLVPELKLEFCLHRICPTVVIGYMSLGYSITFNEKEIERCKNSPKGLMRLLLERCIESQTDAVILAVQTLKDLKYQLKALK